MKEQKGKLPWQPLLLQSIGMNMQQLLVLLRGGSTPGSVDPVVADLSPPGQTPPRLGPGFRER